MKNIAIIIISTLFFTACSKYEEGPEISFLSRKDRVANIWEVDSAYANGDNVTDQFDNYELQLSRDGDAEIDAEFSFLGSEYKANTDGTWELANDDEILVMDFEEDQYDARYQILKLTSNELFLRQQGEDLELQLVTK